MRAAPGVTPSRAQSPSSRGAAAGAAAGRPGLAPFFEARSVAVVGASSDPSKIGGSVLANLRAAGFDGRIVPVNARHAVVQGLAAVPSLLDVADPIDLAVVAVPAAGVLPALQQCVARGVKGAVVISAGFRESGAEGRAREAEIRAWLRDAPLRVIGPNCLGWIRPSRRLNLTFAPGMPRTGPLGFFSHSGALGTAILDWSRERGVGFSLFASLGNQADVTETDVIAALARDAETRVIIGYVEGVDDGRAFFEALRAAAALKPCVLMKGGRSSEGARAVSSHTGALAGSDAAFDAAVRQAGAVRVDTVEELFDLALALAAQPLPARRGIVMVTNGGGLGILATDAARAASLDVAPPADDVRARLAAVLPRHAALGNPIDLVGDATAARYAAALQALDGDTPCLVMLAPQAVTDAAGVARAIVGATRGWRAPVLAAFSGGARVRAGAQALEESGIPCYPFPERAVKALAGMATLAARRGAPSGGPEVAVDRDAAAAHVARLARDGVRALGLLEAAPLLEAYGIPLLPAALAASAGEAGRIAGRIGLPVAIKIVSPDIPHKTDVGGVRLDLRSVDEVAAAAEAMLRDVRAARPGARLDGVLVQRMARPGAIEMLLGTVRDAQFGPLLVLGFGGVLVEVLRDVATRLAPLAPADVRAMLAELRMGAVLGGVRGRPPADVEALVDAACRFSRLAADLEGLAELEANPLHVTPAGVVAVDVRGRLG